MIQNEELFSNPFHIEHYRGRRIDFVHIISVQKVADGKKPSDQSDKRQANIVLERIEHLRNAGIEVRFIETVTEFNPPSNPNNQDSFIIGGAFSGQCITAYTEMLDKKGIPYEIDSLLTVRA